MEEILNMWTKDLEKYTREFHKQAAQVAEWDRQLIENGNKVISRNPGKDWSARLTLLCIDL